MRQEWVVRKQSKAKYIRQQPSDAAEGKRGRAREEIKPRNQATGLSNGIKQGIKQGDLSNRVK